VSTTSCRLTPSLGARAQHMTASTIPPLSVWACGTPWQRAQGTEAQTSICPSQSPTRSLGCACALGAKVSGEGRKSVTGRTNRMRSKREAKREGRSTLKCARELKQKTDVKKSHIQSLDDDIVDSTDCLRSSLSVPRQSCRTPPIGGALPHHNIASCIQGHGQGAKTQLWFGGGGV
jgi:hypothetical protein